MAAVGGFVLVVLCTVGVAIAATQEELLRASILSRGPSMFTLSSDLVLTRDLPPLPAGKVFTLKGSGSKPVKVDGQGRYRIFRNAEETVVTLSLSNLYFTRSKEAAVDLRSLGTKLTISGVTFERLPRALQLELVTATITSSKFLRNTNTSIKIESQEGEPDIVSIKNSEFTSNTANRETGGGAIYASLYSTVTIEGSTFTNNFAAYNGGAVRFRQSYGTIRNCVFTNNVAKEQGGAASLFKGGLTIASSTFKGNKAQTQHGGALRAGSDGDESSFISALNSKFISNSAPKGYGGVFVLDTGAAIRFCSSTFSGNTGKSGAISNGFIIGLDNTIETTPKVTIPFVKLDVGATFTTASGEKCDR